MKHEYGEMGTIGSDEQDTFVCDVEAMTDVQFLQTHTHTLKTSLIRVKPYHSVSINLSISDNTGTFISYTKWQFKLKTFLSFRFSSTYGRDVTIPCIQNYSRKLAILLHTQTTSFSYNKCLNFYNSMYLFLA